MSFFPRGFISEPSPFTPLFQLLDEYGDYQSSARRPHQHRGAITKTFAPKFDVKELADSYELHGELPGIEQKDVDIEFTDVATLTVRGKSERSYRTGTPPAGVIEDVTATEAIEAAPTGNKHQATVEEEGGQVTRPAPAAASPKPREPEAKFWVSERSVGEFSRSFSFPERVDQDAVRASMRNGILSVIVPKARKQEKRKITIS
jgi:HSP20 family protein